MPASTGRKTRKRQYPNIPFEKLPQPDPKPIRQQILEACIPVTLVQRNNTYGDPLVNLGLAGHLKGVARGYAVQRHISYGEWEAIDLLLTKISRIITGGKINRDNYIDAANYAAIAGEIAERTQELSEGIRALKEKLANPRR